MKFHSPIILIISKSRLCVHFTFLLLSIEVIFLLTDFWQHLAMKASQNASDVIYILFLLSKWILKCIYASTTETQISVRPIITNMADPRPPIFTTSWHHFFSACPSLTQRTHRACKHLTSMQYRMDPHLAF